MPRFPAIIFDMDGVITDTEPLHRRAELRVCRNHGLNPPESDWRGFQGMTTVGIFGILVGRYGQGREDLDPEAMAGEKGRFYEEMGQKEGLPTIPGAIEFIRKARDFFDRTALATSSEVSIQKLTFDRYGLWPYFDAVVTGNDVRCGKPWPDPYLLASERLGLAPSDCLVIEDSDNGIRSALAAGCTPVGFTGNFPSGLLLAVGARATFDSYGELEERLRSGTLVAC
ncbi:HAD family phosphatase [Candidatus Uhrbacteria bacterium]|nr:HAD family phosphatase [Candidatus Uhrbacteria bacterium]